MEHGIIEKESVPIHVCPTNFISNIQGIHEYMTVQALFNF